MYTPQVQSFLTDSVDLKRLLSQVKSKQAKAINTLVSLMGSADEAVRLKAATKMLELQIEIADIISKDQMQRLVAEMKINVNSTALLPTDDKKKVEVNFNDLIVVD